MFWPITSARHPPDGRLASNSKRVTVGSQYKDKGLLSRQIARPGHPAESHTRDTLAYNAARDLRLWIVRLLPTEFHPKPTFVACSKPRPMPSWSPTARAKSLW